MITVDVLSQIRLKRTKLACGIAAFAIMAPLSASASTAFTSTWPPAPVTSISACVPSGVSGATDYQVGAGKTYTTLDQVPWESLKPGDTVRIFYSATPYRGHMLIPAAGTLAAPVRVCGVKDVNGNRPIIDGQNAVARRGLSYTAASMSNIQETRALIMIDRLGTAAWTAAPSYIQVDGLELRNANPSYTFTNSAGGVQSYDSFGGCIWMQRAHHVIIADNVIHDCTNGIYSQSTDDSAPPTYTGDAQFAATRNIQIIGNYIYNQGVVGDVHEHNSYIQSVGVVYEFNRYGGQVSGALGNNLKDRSCGSIVRYNRFEGGAHAIDLVEAQDYWATASAEPSYRLAYVYGNQIVKDGGTGSVIHYGGDHYGASAGSTWGEPTFRKGTLYFWNNTIYATGSAVEMFQISTTDEHAQIWNNVLASASTISYTGLRDTTDGIGAGLTAGGTITFGVNWINSNWGPNANQWNAVPGVYTGTSNFITGSTLPISVSTSNSAASTLAPLAGGAAIGRAQAQLTDVASYALKYQASLLSGYYVPLSFSLGSTFDLGGVQSTAAFPPSAPPAVTAVLQK